MHYLLFYEVGADFVARRQQFRALHLEHARRSVAQGDLILGGAVGDPVDGALLLFQAEDATIRNCIRSARLSSRSPAG